MGQAWGRIPQALIPAGQQDRLCPNSPGAPLVFSILVANCTNGHGIQTKLSALQMGRSKLRPPPGKSSPPTRWSPRHFPAFSARLEILFL